MSVGIVSGRTLPFVGTNDTIQWFRQALSLDEVCTRRHLTNRFGPHQVYLIHTITATCQVPPEPVSPPSGLSKAADSINEKVRDPCPHLTNGGAGYPKRHSSQRLERSRPCNNIGTGCQHEGPRGVVCRMPLWCASTLHSGWTTVNS